MLEEGFGNAAQLLLPVLNHQMVICGLAASISVCWELST
jgi:hypothetical protein